MQLNSRKYDGIFGSPERFTRAQLRSQKFILFPADRYTDPVDGSQASNQGLILGFEYPNGDPARVVFRLSGTGSAGATIRMYLERYEKDESKHDESAPNALKSLADRALGLVQMEKLTGREAPTVIT